MDPTSPLAAALAAGFALLAAGAILALLRAWGPGRAASGGAAPGGAAPGGAEEAAFLFEGEALVDATPAARRLLPPAAEERADLAAVLALLGRPEGEAGLGEALAALGPDEARALPAPGGGALRAAREGGLLRLSLDAEAALAARRRGQRAAEEELLTLRALAEDAPQLIWSEDDAGGLTWANRAFLHLADAARPPGEGVAGAWPSRPLFPPPPPLAEGASDTRRLSLSLPGRPGPQWFEVTSVRRGPGTVRFAADAGSLVSAEAARAVFVQTLTKTFATLSTGLAIFDRARRLQLFNPAFVDLTGLPVAFLSGRPLVHSVLDRLRDARVLPEPRDYASWRDRLAALEAAAAEGHYLETWSLPGGRTWRVSGRPHPDGALAFLFEDISDEVTLARRFRAEIEAAQGALDGLEEAVAAFGPTGTLQVANAAYARLWGPGGGLDERALAAEARRWRAGAAPSPFWDALDAHLAGGERPGPAVLRLADGTAVAARLAGLAGGATLASFRRLEAPEGLGGGLGGGAAPGLAEPGPFASRRRAAWAGRDAGQDAGRGAGDGSETGFARSPAAPEPERAEGVALVRALLAARA